MRRSSGAALGLGLIASISVALPALADPQIVEKQTVYNLTGATLHDLIRQVNASGPADGNSPDHFFARTDWHVDWRYVYRRAHGVCAITKLRVTATIAYFYPHWVNEAGADAVSRAAWENFLINLQTHERGHGQHGIDAAKDVEQAITALPPQARCAALKASINATGLAVIEEYGRRDDEYDRATKHGATQGAVLRD